MCPRLRPQQGELPPGIKAVFSSTELSAGRVKHLSVELRENTRLRTKLFRGERSRGGASAGYACRVASSACPSFRETDLEKLAEYLRGSEVRGITPLSAAALMRIVEDSIRKRESFTLPEFEETLVGNRIVASWSVGPGLMEPPVLATRCSSLIHLLQQALVIQLIERVLWVNHVSRTEFLESFPQVAFLLQREAEAEVRQIIIGVQT